MSEMPALFIGHGSPMNTLETNRFTAAWQQLGRTLPRPRAILVISAHWYFGATAVTAMPAPRTIHDFYGFPRALYDFQYPAPGDPALAQRVVEVAAPHWVGLDHDQWGLDHGAWSVLAHLYPAADIPVLQLSINALKPLDWHLRLGASLAPLRREGVLLLASGNVVHNLGRIDWEMKDGGYDWGRRFDDAVVEQLARDPSGILALADHPDHDLAVPTPDHFIPLLYLAGLAGDQPLQPLLRGHSLGGISMTCFGLGCDVHLAASGEPAAEIPARVPPDSTNT